MLVKVATALPLLLSFLSSVAAIDANLVGLSPGANAGNVKHKASGHDYIDEKAFMKAMLDEHNKAREEHGADPVTWDPKLADFAKGVVKTCKWGHSVIISSQW